MRDAGSSRWRCFPSGQPGSLSRDELGASHAVSVLVSLYGG